jgi:hypothetical protein
MSKRKHKKKPTGNAWSSKMEVVETVVDNPMFSTDHDVSRTNPLKTKAYINIRESPLGLLAAKGLLTAAQLKAGSQFRALWEQLGSSIKAMDYSKDPVDGGGMSEPISIRQMQAGLDLKECRKVLGPRHYDVLVKVLGQGIEVSKLGKTRRERDTYMDYLKHALEDLAEHWGYQTTASKISKSA